MSRSGVSIQVGSKPFHQMASGVGASWHSIMNPTVGNGGSAMGATPPVIARHEKLWQSIYRHADWLGLKFIRLEMEWRQFEPERGQYTWDSTEMKILDRICQWAQSRGADVMLQCSWINADWCCLPEFLGDPALKLYSAPSDVPAWARSWVVLLKELVQKRGYTCIKWINLVNEPACTWWFVPETADNFGKTHDQQMASLAAAMKVIKAAMVDAKLPVKLMGPGETDMPVYKSIKPEPWFPVVDDVDFHCYCSNFDFDDPTKQPMTWGYRIGDRIVKNMTKYRRETRAAGKGLYFTEVGTQTYGCNGTEATPTLFKATLKDTEVLIRSLNLGLDGFSHWSFVNRGDLDGQWQYIDTWGLWPKLWLKEARPHPWCHYVLGLATRHIPKYAKLLPTKVVGSELKGIQRVWAQALTSPRDGSFTMLVVNDAQKPQNIKLSTKLTGPLYRLTVSERRPVEQALEYDTVRLDAGNATLRMPAFSLMILTDAMLPPEVPGRF